ncbi:unnamed protein product [Acanthoscelides obtectus]|uniref:DDE Tnp4 domain-containing protein n=1 Tax=Acanthoscelides obtectus TaxID=200917 RepID=A0A9P0LEP9_ACAOB|nr:unnamed protein product [Acanthoscelides obtectus]CAK1680705.1 Putative nuclease HARBI1 [Acanthoscelides obtectus]
MNKQGRQKYRAVLKKCLVQAADILLNEIEEVIEEETSKQKRIWVRDWIKRRDKLGASANLLRELALEDPVEYRMCLRMTPDSFETLLNLIKPHIQKMDTFMRDAIPARVKLEITLNFLATGNSYRSLQHLFRVSKPAISNFIPAVCEAMNEALHEYFKMPTTEEEWKIIANGFEEHWNFPGCCGALDGKHILILCPGNSGSQFFNYKGSYSVVLMALVDQNYCFTYVCIGSQGSQSDGGIFQKCALGNLLQNGLLPAGYCIVGDDAFPLRHYLMKPRARKIVENSFGILVSRFRIFDKKINCKLETVNKIVLAACALHNFLRKTSPAKYLPRGSVDEEDIITGSINPGQWRAEITELRRMERYHERRKTNLANQIRDNLKNYFTNEGAVSWQYKNIY